MRSFSSSRRRVIGFYFSLLLLAVFIFEPLVLSTHAQNAKTRALTSDQRVSHVLSRLTYGARSGDAEKIKASGIQPYIDQQLNYESIDDSELDKRLSKLPTLNMTAPAIGEQYSPTRPTPTPTPSPLPGATPVPSPNPSPTATPSPTPTPKNPGMVIAELQRAKVLRATYSNRQLYEMTVDFWMNHFTVNGNRDALRMLTTTYERDAVRPFAMERFRDLLGAVAHSPAMLFYLDNWQSSVIRKYAATKTKPASQAGGINENYARELLELHTMGVDGGYTQADVQEVARCFTGWTIRKPNDEGTFIFNPAWHDNGEKTVLGQKIAAGGGIADGERVLDILAKHPATARFVATKLARRFYGDTPPKAVIDKAALVFLKTDGSIRETIRALVTSPAFFAPSAYQAKVRTPFEFVVAALRVTNAETDGNRPVLDWISRMGQPVYGRITPDGYPDNNAEWLSNNDLLARLNFASALSMNALKGTTIDKKKLLPVGIESDSPALVSHFAALILMDRASPKTREDIGKFAFEPVQATWSNTAQNQQNKPPDHVAQIITLMLGAPEFQRK